MSSSLVSPVLISPWTNVATSKGVKIRFEGSLQWTRAEGSSVGGSGHVKGILMLQRRIYPTGISAWGGIAFRLWFDGHVAGDPTKSTAGAINLPSKVGWRVFLNKVKSQDGLTMARTTDIKFDDNSEDLVKLKLYIPFTGAGTLEKLFGEALQSADLQCRSAVTANTPKTPASINSTKHSKRKISQVLCTPKHPDYTSKEAADNTPRVAAAMESSEDEDETPLKRPRIHHSKHRSKKSMNNKI